MKLEGLSQFKVVRGLGCRQLKGFRVLMGFGGVVSLGFKHPR